MGGGQAATDSGKNPGLRYDRRARRERLQKHGLTVLYHCTSAVSAATIEESGKFLRGTACSEAGGGIYLATSPEDAASLCECGSKDVLFECDVLLGQTLQLTQPEGSLTFTRLLNRGYDSATIDMGSGREYIVYNYDQVKGFRRIAMSTFG